MKKTITDFFTAWWFLENHPAFVRDIGRGFKKGQFQKSLDIYVSKVNPKSNRILKDEAKNTKTQVWLECGKWLSAKEVMPKGAKIPKDYFGAFSHDVKLDCGADTFEDAIIKLSSLVLKEYGDYDA